MKIENIAEANKLIAQRDVCIRRINEFKRELQNIINKYYHETDDAYPPTIDEKEKVYCVRMSFGGGGIVLRLNKQSVMNLLQQNIVIMEERKKEIENIISSL